MDTRGSLTNLDQIRLGGGGARWQNVPYRPGGHPFGLAPPAVTGPESRHGVRPALNRGCWADTVLPGPSPDRPVHGPPWPSAHRSDLRTPDPRASIRGMATPVDPGKQPLLGTTGERSIGQLVSDVSTDLSQIVRGAAEERRLQLARRRIGILLQLLPDQVLYSGVTVCHSSSQ